MNRVRLSCTTSAPIGEAIEQLLWSGLYGRTRAAVVERLICEAIETKARAGLVKLEDLHSPPSTQTEHHSV